MILTWIAWNFCEPDHLVKTITTAYWSPAGRKPAVPCQEPAECTGILCHRIQIPAHRWRLRPLWKQADCRSEMFLLFYSLCNWVSCPICHYSHLAPGTAVVGGSSSSSGWHQQQECARVYTSLHSALIHFWFSEFMSNLGLKWVGSFEAAWTGVEPVSLLRTWVWRLEAVPQRQPLPSPFPCLACALARWARSQVMAAIFPDYQIDFQTEYIFNHIELFFYFTLFLHYNPI